MDFVDIKLEKPQYLQDIIAITSVGKTEGVYLKNDIVQTKKGLFNFTKWKKK